MNRHFLNRVITLIAALGLAVTSLLLLFLLLGEASADVAANGVEANLAGLQVTTSTFTISGTVISSEDGSGIGGVDVFPWNRDEGPSTSTVSATTLASGTYSLTLEAGNYDLIFNPPCGSGFASQSHKGITGPPDVTLTVPLTVGYAISGTVYAIGTLSPVSNTAIYAFNHDTADGFGLPPTDANGHYCIGLIGGPYDLGFTPPACLGLGPETVSITVTHDMITDVILPPGFTVAGRITDRAGEPVSGVQIYARECYTTTGYGFSPSNQNGYYTGTLPLGTFGIQFLPPADPPGLGPKTVTDVVSTTAGCPNTRLDVTLPDGFTISGQVTCQAEPVKNVFVYADPVGPSPDCYGLDGVGVYTVDDGSYGLPVVPGTYDIKFIPPTATGFDELVITDFQVITDTVLNANFCPLFLPLVFKNYNPRLVEVSGILHTGDVCAYCCYPVMLWTTSGPIELSAFDWQFRQYDGLYVKVLGWLQGPCEWNSRQVIAVISIDVLGPSP
jgi:hypothetical protein